MKVLIAEDEQTIANGIAAILKTREEFHCQIRFAENGQDALEEARTFCPDLVLTDIRMFKMTGLELAKALQEEQLCSNVIIISGYSNFDYARRAMRANVLDYLLKPIDRQELLALVEKVWQSLPDNYAAQSARTLPPHPFFQLELEKEEYPGSLKKAVAFLLKNYMQDLSLQSLSEELMLNPSYLSSLINKYIQVNFNHLLDFVRLQKACELLLSSPEMTMSEISYVVGYNGERRFYNAFQKRLSCTPGEYRKNKGHFDS